MAMERRWKPWILLAGAAAGLLLGAALWAEWHIRSVWSRMERDVEALLAEVRAHDGRRPVPLGEPVPGNAWEDYQSAFLLIGPHLDLSKELGLYRDSPDAVTAAAAKLLDQDSVALQRLRAGARRVASKCDVPRNAPFDIQLRNRVFYTLNLAVWDVVRQRDRGHLSEAIRRTLMLQQILRDLEHATSDTFGSSTFYFDNRLFGQWKSLLAEFDATPADLRSFENALQALDDGLPPVSEFLKNVVLSEGLMARERTWRSHPHGSGELPTGARLLWSERLTLADAYFRHAATLRHASRKAHLPWPELRASIREREAADRSAPNPYYREFHAHAEYWVGLHLQRQAHLRLIRAAFHLRATGRMPDLQDPFGDRLLHRQAGALDRIWSVGPNGVDDRDAGGGDDIEILLKR